MGKSYIVNGHKLYIETFGKTDSEPILYFHGKPGIGVIDLTEFQKEMLEKQFFIIVLQRILFDAIICRIRKIKTSHF